MDQYYREVLEERKAQRELDRDSTVSRAVRGAYEGVRKGVKYLGFGGTVGALTGFALTGGPIGLLAGAAIGKNIRGARDATTSTIEIARGAKAYEDIDPSAAYTPAAATGIRRAGNVGGRILNASRNAEKMRRLEEIAAKVEQGTGRATTPNEVYLSLEAEKKRKEEEKRIAGVVNSDTFKEHKARYLAAAMSGDRATMAVEATIANNLLAMNRIVDGKLYLRAA